MGSTSAGANALAKAVDHRGYSCTADQAALREVCSTLALESVGHTFHSRAYNRPSGQGNTFTSVLWRQAFLCRAVRLA